jgi:hypothetical protein
MILERLDVDPEQLPRRTGWEIKPEGACKGDRCVPLPEGGDTLGAQMLSEKLGMALVHDAAHGLWALGPESVPGGRALLSAELPDITLPDREGRNFSLRSLRGTKIFMLAWASW